ncbi:MAG: phosphatidate cytidylyltransferase [Chitinophagaceae bacterium]|nr:MAG: phosphatidate cytidylyltransferase [Chitinophagaceae bacterium]
MAIDKKILQTRSRTAIVFVAVMLLGLLWNKWSFFLLFSVIHFGCWWEYLKLVEKIQKQPFHFLVKSGLMFLSFSMLLFSATELNLSIIGFLIADLFLPVFICGATLIVLGNFNTHRNDLKANAFTAFGLIYISLSLAFMIDLFDLKAIEISNIFFPFLIIITIWLNDSLAYFVGSLIGKTPLSKVSPKKTWEGTVGGIVCTMIILGAVGYFNSVMEITHLLFIVGIVTIAGTFGDLFESKLKRMAAVKDSGSFMPGHGGFLDRFDSLLFAIPAVWVYIYCCMK